MKRGRFDVRTSEGLEALVRDIHENAQGKRDFVADTRRMAFEFAPPPEADPALAEVAAIVNSANVATAPPPALVPVLNLGDPGRFAITNHSHNQISQAVGIPKKYYDRMLVDAPDLLAHNVNAWFRREPKMRMVRTLHNKARAVLSDRYRPIENEDVFNVIYPIFAELGIRMVSAEVTENRFYVKALFRERQAEVKKGDIIETGVSVRNSEIGLGAIEVSPFIHRLVCLNGMVVNDAAFRKAHVGKIHQGGENGATEIYRDDTKQAIDEAWLYMIRDTVRAAGSQDFADRQAEKLRAATEDKIVGDPVAATVCLQEKFGLSDSARTGIMRHLIEGGDLSRYGMAQAVTRYSQDVEDYDAATDLEVAGGAIIELPKTEWRVISEGRASKRRLALA